MTPPLRDRPADRYGDAGTGQQRALYAVAGGLAALCIAWVAWVTLGADSNPVSAQVTGYQQVGNRVVRAQVVVTAPADTTAQCTLRALDEDRAVVGRAEVTSPAGGTSRGASVDIRVLTSASSVEIVNCSAA